MQLVEVQRVRETLDELGVSWIPRAGLTSSSAWNRSKFACRSFGRVGTVPSGSGGGGRTVGNCCIVGDGERVDGQVGNKNRWLGGLRKIVYPAGRTESCRLEHEVRGSRLHAWRTILYLTLTRTVSLTHSSFVSTSTHRRWRRLRHASARRAPTPPQRHTFRFNFDFSQLSPIDHVHSVSRAVRDPPPTTTASTASTPRPRTGAVGTYQA